MPGPTPQRTVLIVDDYRPLLDAARRSLRDCQVLTAEGPSEARRISVEHKPDIAIVDVFLGEWSGIDLIRDLTSDRPELIVVA